MTVATLYLMLALHQCSGACAAGVIANFEAEAGPALDPCIVGRSGIGLPQLAGPRRTRILAQLGSRWCDAKAQVEYVIMELTEFGLRDRLFAATDPGEAARLFMVAYEKPRSRDPRGRMARARMIYEQYR